MKTHATHLFQPALIALLGLLVAVAGFAAFISFTPAGSAVLPPAGHATALLDVSPFRWA